MSAKAHQQAQPDAAGSGIIVFGMGSDSKLRAARFATNHVQLANKAAKALGFRTLPIENEAARELAAKLPVGRIHMAGVGAVPTVKPSVFEQVTALAKPKEGGKNGPMPAASDGPSPQTL